MKTSIIYPELKEKTNAQITYVCAYNGGLYLTTDLDLKGRGIKLSGDGSNHLRNKKTYFATERAFKILEQKYSTCYLANL